MNGCAVNFEFQCIQGDGGGVFCDIQIYNGGSFECELLKIDLEGHIIVFWYDIVRQDDPALGVDHTR